ncbi:MAG: hypothetical protein ACOZNI_22940 [Myxococcota bacterium]
MSSLLQDLEGVPAWRDGATRALARHRDALVHVTEDRPAVLLRLAELLAAAGLAGQAFAAAHGVDPASLDADRRERRAFLLARLLARVPDLGEPGPPVAGDTPLGALRHRMLDAERAQVAGDRPAAGDAWARALAVPATGLAADELHFEAAKHLAAARLLESDAAAAAMLLARAAAIARRHGADADEAALGLSTYAALAAQRDRPAVAALCERAAVLPADVPGALPPALVAQVRAARVAMTGDVSAAVRALDDALSRAHAEADWPGYASLALAKAIVFEEVGEPYPRFRTLLLARSLLRRSDPATASLLDTPVKNLEREVGPEAWAAFGARLKREVSAT